MAALWNKQTFVNDGGGRSTSSTYKPKTSTGSAQNKKVTTNNTNAYYSSSVNPNYNYSVSTSAPKTTTTSSSNYGAPRAVASTAPQTTLNKATQILQKNANSSNSALARASQNALNKINNASPQQKAKANQALESASQRLSQDAVDRLTTGVVKQPVAKLGQRAQTNPVTPRVVGAETPQILNNWTATPVANNNNNDNNNGNNYTPKTYQAPAFVEAEPTYSAPVATSNNTSTVTQEQKNVDDTVDKIKELLEEQKRQADAYYKTMYEQQLSSDKEEWENARNQINRNYVRTNRYLNNMYGDAVSGIGLSNRARNYANWNNNLASNQRNYDNNVASALAQYNNNLANTANTLSQGWYNYVLPIYSNREQNANNMDYQRWAYEQNLNNRRQMNLDDLDYRKYLATLGLR